MLLHSSNAIESYGKWIVKSFARTLYPPIRALHAFLTFHLFVSFWKPFAGLLFKMFDPIEKLANQAVQKFRLSSSTACINSLIAIFHDFQTVMSWWAFFKLWFVSSSTLIKNMAQSRFWVFFGSMLGKLQWTCYQWSFFPLFCCSFFVLGIWILMLLIYSHKMTSGVAYLWW